MVRDELELGVRPNSAVLSAYRRGQSAASSIERSVADAYNRMASRLPELETALRAGRHRHVTSLIERFWLTIFYITSILDASQGGDIITRIKALNLFVLKCFARARRSGLASDIEGVGGMLSTLSEIFLSLDLARRHAGEGDKPSVQHHRAFPIAGFQAPRPTQPRVHRVAPYQRAPL